MQSKQRFRPIHIGMLAVTAFLALFALINAPVALRPAARMLLGRIHFPEFTQRVHSGYTNNLCLKNGFISLNGWFARRLDQTICNEVVRFKNAQLGEGSVGVAPEGGNAEKCCANADHLIAFDRYLKELDIPFLYALAPYKVDQKGECLPDGVYNTLNADADAALAHLREAGVHTLDLRPALSPNAELTRRYFYPTDHHWTFEAAFVGAQEIARELKETRLPELDDSRLNLNLWEAHTLKNWSLGSWGKRVGPCFGGVDDMTYYTPKFETAMSCANPDAQEFFKGDFSDALIRRRYIEKRDYFGIIAYQMYAGYLYPLVHYRNPDAPNDLRVLMIIDSFGKPAAAYLSTLFREVDTIDPRKLKLYSVAEYVRYSAPDLVIQLNNPDELQNLAFCEHGVETAVARDFSVRCALPLAGEVEIAPESGASYAALPVKLSPGQRCVLRFDDVEFPREEPACVTVSLLDAAQQIVDSAIFDLAYCRANGEFNWFFAAPEDANEEFELRFHAGMPGESSPCPAVYRGVRLEVLG